MRVESTPSHQQPQAGSSAAFAGAARLSSLDFTLTTADGDRVTLSTSTTDVLGAVSVTDKDGTSQTAVTSSETSFSLTVEGTLDKRELRDLRKVARFLAGRRGTRRGEAGQAAVASGPGHGGQRQRVSLAVADADWRRARVRTRRPNNRLRTRNRSQPQMLCPSSGQ